MIKTTGFVRHSFPAVTDDTGVRGAGIKLFTRSQQRHLTKEHFLFPSLALTWFISESVATKPALSGVFIFSDTTALIMCLFLPTCEDLHQESETPVKFYLSVSTGDNQLSTFSCSLYHNSNKETSQFKFISLNIRTCSRS